MNYLTLEQIKKRKQALKLKGTLTEQEQKLLTTDFESFEKLIKNQDFFKDAAILFPEGKMGMFSDLGNMAIVKEKIKNKAGEEKEIELNYFVKQNLLLEWGNYIGNELLKMLGIKTTDLSILATNEEKHPFLFVSRDAKWVNKNEQTFELLATKTYHPSEEKAENFKENKEKLAKEIDFDHALRKYLIALVFGLEDWKYSNNLYFTDKNTTKTLPFDFNFFGGQTLFTRTFLDEGKINNIKESFWANFEKTALFQENYLGGNEKMRNPDPQRDKKDHLVAQAIRAFLYKNDESLNEAKKEKILQAAQKILVLFEGIENKIEDFFENNPIIEHLKGTNYFENYLKASKDYYSENVDFENQNLKKINFDFVKETILKNIQTLKTQISEETQNWNKNHADRPILPYQKPTAPENPNKKIITGLALLPKFNQEYHTTLKR